MKKKKEITNYLEKGEQIDLINLEPEILGIIGVELKRRRRQQSRTLDSFECGCSISYISKIENGKITPKYSILQELCTEQGISQYELDSLIRINELLNLAVNAIYYKKHELLEQYCENLEGFENFKVNLLKALYYLSNNSWSEVEALLPSIEIIEDKLSTTDYNLLVYIKLRIYNHRQNYMLAHNEYSKLKVNDNLIINALCYEQYFVSICYCGFENPTHYYDALCKMSLKLYNSNLSSINELYFEALINIGCEIPEVLIESVSSRHRIYYYLKHNRFNELFDYKENHHLTIFEQLIIAMGTKDYLLVKNLYNQLDFTNISKYDMIIANYCKLLIESDDTQIVSYANNVGVPFAEERGDFRLLLYMIKSICEHSLTTGRYKNVAVICMSLFSFVSEYQKHIC